MKAKPSTAKHFPRLQDDDTYREATEKLEDVGARLSTVEGRIRTGEAQRELAAKAQDGRTGRAEAILRGEDPDALGPDISTLEALQKQRTQLLDLQEAERLQRAKVAELRQSVSREICDTIRPQYMKMVAEFATALVASMELAERVFDLRNELQGSGVLYADNLPQQNLTHFLASDPGSRGNLLVNELQKDLGLTIPRPVLQAAELRRAAAIEAQNARDAEVARADGVERARKHTEAMKNTKALADPRNWWPKAPKFTPAA